MMKALIYIALIMPMFAVAQDLDALLQRCAPLVHPVTMGSVISTESRGNPYAILDNGHQSIPFSKRKIRSFRPQTKEEAISIAKQLIADGHIVDLGLGQINNRNLKSLGMTVEDAFDPCKNVTGGQTVLREFYLAAAKKQGYGQAAMLSAISAYNTGSFTRGFRNGYVAKVVAASKNPVSSVRVPSGKRRNNIVISRRQAPRQGVIVGKITKQEAKLASAVAVGW